MATNDRYSLMSPELFFSSLAFASLGSGSKGNGTLICKGDTRVLLDCGFTLKETERRLERLAIAPEKLSAIFVTHEHSDHINGVGPLARKYSIPVYLTAGTWHTGRIGEVPNVELIPSHGSLQLGELNIAPVAVPHDAREPVQYVFQSAGKKLGVLTDLGSFTRQVTDHYADCDALLLEANHCPVMLDNGPYPASLKQRVSSDWGHLSNQQSDDFLKTLTKPLKHLVLAHLSEQNNSRTKVQQVLKSQLQKAENVLFACQQKGFNWLLI
jgi:phosphoribosyl 1,2-cyclic phosphodiesterase